MCRRTIIHYMHHDVRTAITLCASVHDEDAPLHVHPFRTTKHTCDINVVQSLAHIGLPMEAGEDTELGKKRLRPCEYHSCCVCQVALKRCNRSPINVDEIKDVAEPEECADFLLEHRHVPLNVQKLIWGQWARVMNRLGGGGSGSGSAGAVVGLPTAERRQQQQQQQGPTLPKLPEQPQWRDLKHVIFGREWKPVFRRDKDMYLRWSVWMFDRLAELQEVREEDACALAEVRERGLAGGFALMDRMATTSANVRAGERFVRNEFQWAATPPH
ncbi:hypothetical protein PG993_005413 [Apiospora rasikravindrae]|uniref:Uncharacterized protein n=1 Tax=Apiospora rasikravindrae TaxID=990691 RepID=A0ABR1TFI9_9PEZI